VAAVLEEETFCLDFFTLLTLRRTRVVVVVVGGVGVVGVVVVVVVGVDVDVDVDVGVAALVESEPTSLVGVAVTGIIGVVVAAATAAGSDALIVFHNLCQMVTSTPQFFLQSFFLFLCSHTTNAQHTITHSTSQTQHTFSSLPLSLSLSLSRSSDCVRANFTLSPLFCAVWNFSHLTRTAQLYKREKKKEKKSQI
jgi:hypothetical protein